jgi:hypothetical protein
MPKINNDPLTTKMADLEKLTPALAEVYRFSKKNYKISSFQKVSK